MTAPVIPADAVWGVQWEAPVPPMEELPAKPSQPPAGTDAGDPAWSEYNTAIAQWQAAVLELIAMKEEWWEKTVSQFPDEPTARDMYVKLKANHDASPFARGTTVVWSQPTVWTPVE